MTEKLYDHITAGKSSGWGNDLSYASFAGLSKAFGGLTKTLGSALSSKLGGTVSKGLGDSAKSLVGSGGKALGAGGTQGSKPGGNGGMLASLSSRLGGDSEKGKFSGLLGKLGGALKGTLGGALGGKQGSGIGDSGGEGGGAKSSGGGITSMLLKGISSRVGGDENSEPTAGILSGLSGKLIDKARGNEFLNSLMEKAGGSEALKEKAQGLIAGLDTGAITKKITGAVEGDEENKGLINTAKEKLTGKLQKATPVTKPIDVTSEAVPEPESSPKASQVIASNLHQGKVFITVNTPLGRDTVVLSEFKARERISDLFECTALFISDHNDLDIGDLIGKSFTVGLVIDNDEEQPPEEEKGPLTKAKDLLGSVKKAVGLGNKSEIAKKMTAAKQTTFAPRMPEGLSFGSFAGLSKALGGLSKTLGSALSSKLGGGASKGLGDSVKSLASSGGKALGAGASQGSKTSSGGGMLAGLTSRLGGDSEKGKFSGLLGKLGGALKGTVGGALGGKQGTGIGKSGGEGGGAKSGGGGITSTLLKGLSSRLGGNENSEPTAGVLSGLSGKLIDKARGNEFLNGLMEKVGGSEALKEKVQGYIDGLNTGAVTQKLSGMVEGDDKNKGLINIAKEKIVGLFKKNQTVASPMDVSSSGEASPRRAAFGDTQFPKDGLDQRDPNVTIRYFNGIVGEIVQGPTEQGVSNLTMYTAKIYPKLWLLKHTKNCRIFQKMTAMEIIGTILKENNITDVMDKTQSAGQIIREYCVQYNESHFDFISRLMEFEGIFYYFIHTENTHVLVLADAPEAHHMCPQTRKAYMEQSLDSLSYFNCIQTADILTRVVPGEHALTDYDFELPRKNLFSKVKGRGYGGRIYEYPGNFRTRSDGESFARLRIESDELSKDIMYGQSTIPFFETGAYFTLSGHIRSEANKKYVLAEVEHYASQQLGGDEENTLYENTYIAFDYEAGPYRPTQKTPKPRIHGTQTARVTGKEGEEIWTDEYGRVKVHFHWDENDKEDENTSCWVRVSQGWAGNGWGMLFTPRIGHEVVVTFLNGDPDEPLITGSVYNGEKLPPYLPDEPTISTIKSNSSKDSKGFNEIRFQDLADQEEFYMHAEKDMFKEINNNSSTIVHRGDDSKVIETGSRTVHLMGQDAPKTERAVSKEIKGTGDDTLILDKGSRTELLNGQGKEKGNYTTVIKKGDRSLTIEKGDESTTLVDGNRSITLAKGDETHTINGKFSQQVTRDYTLDIAGNLNINVAGKISINGGRTFFMNVGQGATMIAGERIYLLSLEAIKFLTMDIDSKALMTSKSMAGIDNTVIGGAKATLQAGGVATVSGSVVAIG